MQTAEVDLSKLRRDYTNEGLLRSDLHPEPVEQFRLWFSKARDCAMIAEPNAMALCTIGARECPNVRTVLLKAFDRRGFVFFTNYESEKAREIAANNRVALLFQWLALERQLKIQGRAERISRAQSLKYFLSRPIGSRLGAWVSHQSKVISSRSLLAAKLAEIKCKFAEGEVSCPEFWGGYRVVPVLFEFWQGGRDRLHDRFRYTRSSRNSDWKIERLAP